MTKEYSQKKINTREIVLDILLQLEKEPEYSNRLIKAVLDKYAYISAQERSFIKRLAEGSIERRIELDYVTDLFSKVPVKKMKPLIRSLMRMSVYQILYMDGVPDSAVCNEAVKLAEKRNFRNLKGFVNGCLRTVSRKKNEIAYPDPDTDPALAASVRYSMPLWLVEKWRTEYGDAKTEQILKGLLAIKPVSLRVSSRTDENRRKDWMEQVRKTGTDLQRHPFSPFCFLAENTDGITELPGFREGFFTVQDYSSVLAVEAADIREGDLVMDLCAAPGGKSLYAAEKAGKNGKVLSGDVSENKAERIRESAERMKIENISVRVQDARQLIPEYREKADVVLADVPCSGLGVIGKKSDIKYRITPEDFSNLNILQKEIIKTGVQYVKPGGTLLYSTCTVNRQENEETVKWICQNFPFEPESLNRFLPAELQSAETDKGYLQLFPEQCHCDGFFIARLKKIKEEV